MQLSEFINGSRTLIFLDLETTGRDFTTDRIMEVGGLKVSGNQVKEKIQILVNPERPIPLTIQRLTGIKEQQVQEKGKRWEEVKNEVRNFLGNFPVVCHNASFDRSFLLSQGLDLPNPFYDTCELACLLFPCLGHYSLTAILSAFGEIPQQSHRAFSDCENTYRLWCLLLDSLKLEHVNRLEKIKFFLKETDWPLVEILTELIDYLKKQSKPEKIRPPDSLEEREETKEQLPEFSSVFAPEGFFSRVFPGYEVRPEQQQMADSVWQAFKEKKYLFLEAGTGVGKSLAYLVPALYYVKETGARVVISTNTKNLQDQLWHKEIPFLQKCFPGSFTACLVKGRENYVCLRKLYSLSSSPLPLFPEEKKALAYLSSWVEETESGLLEEISSWYLTKVPVLKEMVEQIRSEKENCLSRRCPWHRSCFYLRTRQKASEADWIVTNHALIFDPPRWFPPFSCLVLDEAHNVEEVATEVFSREVSLQTVKRILDWLDEKHRFHRLKPVWAGLTREGKIIETSWKNIRKKLAEKVEILRKEILPAFSNCLSAVLPEKKARRIEKNQNSTEWELFNRAGRDFLTAWSNLEELLTELENCLDNVFPANYNRMELRQSVSSLRERVKKIKEDGNFILKSENQQYVFWLELEGREKNNWLLKAAPLNPGEWLASFFQKRESVIFTSATLTVAGDFSFQLERVGANLLPESRLVTKVLGSPFDYHRCVLLGIPVDFPNFCHQQPQAFLQALTEGIFTACQVTRGKILVLFNSVERMHQIYSFLKPRLESENIMVFCQGIDGSRKHLVELMNQADQETVLFGTKSFREGVDIANLTGVILEKLPFPSPEEPIVAGRIQHLLSQGKDAWNQYLLPLATMALRQAFGRLIRKKKDKGFFLVFDARLLGNFRQMKQALPCCQELIEPGEFFAAKLARALLQLKEEKSEKAE